MGEAGKGSGECTCRRCSVGAGSGFLVTAKDTQGSSGMSAAVAGGGRVAGQLGRVRGGRWRLLVRSGGS